MGLTFARLALVVSLASVIAACRKSSPPSAPPTPTVRVETVRAQNVPLQREWLATLDGSTTAQIQPQVTGSIVAVNYREGSAVEEGQVLFTLEKRPFVAAAEKARGDYAQAVAQLNKSRADVKRYVPLVTQQALSTEQLEDARAAVKQYEATVQSTKAALDTALINLEWTEVRSPIKGLAGLAQTRVGTLVNPSQVLTIVSTLDPMRASFSVSQQEYLRYADAINHPNAPEFAQQRYFELILADGRVYPHRARDVVVNRQIESTTGTLQVQAFFPNPEGYLRPGLFGSVRMHAGTSGEAPVLPERAVTELQGKHQVAVLDDQGRVQIREVTLGQMLDHEYVVDSGLRPGERIVVEGQQNLLPGTKVNVAQAQAQAKPPPGRPQPASEAAEAPPTEPRSGAEAKGGAER